MEWKRQSAVSCAEAARGHATAVDAVNAAARPALVSRFTSGAAGAARFHGFSSLHPNLDGGQTKQHAGRIGLPTGSRCAGRRCCSISLYSKFKPDDGSVHCTVTQSRWEVPFARY